MKGYFRKSFIAVAASLLVAVGGMFMVGCTDVDDTLGLHLVPDDQRVEVTTRTFTGIRSYAAYSDSIPTSRLRGMAFGSMTTDFGRTTVRSVNQFMPLVSYTKRGNHYFGAADAVVDSAYIVLYVNKISGNTAAPQTFGVFPLDEAVSDTWIDFTKEYYSDYDMSGKYKTEPVFEFTLEKEIAGARYKKLWPVGAEGEALYDNGKAYLEGIVGLPQSVWKDEEVGDGKFHAAVPGFYFEPKAPSAGEAIYEVLMVDSYYLQDLSYLAIYTHNPADGATAKALETKFYFDDKAASYADLSNLSIMLVDHDYSSATNGIDPATFLRYQERTDENGTPQPGKPWVMPALYDDAGNPIVDQQEEMYVQTMVGASGYISFDQALKQELAGILNSNGTEYSSVFIDKAKLILPLAYDKSDPDYAAKMMNLPYRMGLYLDYKGDLPVSMPDYPYMDEIANSKESKFGGYLNYSKAQYEMDVSTYARQLIMHPDDTRGELWIAPAFNASNFTRLQEVVLQNKTPNLGDPLDKSREIELVITYALIK